MLVTTLTVLVYSIPIKLEPRPLPTFVTSSCNHHACMHCHYYNAGPFPLRYEVSSAHASSLIHDCIYNATEHYIETRHHHTNIFAVIRMLKVLIDKKQSVQASPVQSPFSFECCHYQYDPSDLSPILLSR